MAYGIMAVVWMQIFNIPGVPNCGVVSVGLFEGWGGEEGNFS